MIDIRHYVADLPAIVVDIHEYAAAQDEAKAAERFAGFVESANAVVDGLKRMVADARGLAASDLVLLMDQADRLERKAARGWASLQRSLDEAKALSIPAVAPASVRLAHIKLQQHIVDVMAVARRAAEAYRDARWQLAALRSELEDQGQGPVVSTVKDFDKAYGGRR